MPKLFCFVFSVIASRLRGRVVVVLENLALRRKLNVPRRQRAGELRLFAIDRWLWVCLYRIWPRSLDTMLLVKRHRRSIIVEPIPLNGL
jgi:hypothetical protein